MHEHLASLIFLLAQHDMWGGTLTINWTMGIPASAGSLWCSDMSSCRRTPRRYIMPWCFSMLWRLSSDAVGSCDLLRWSHRGIVPPRLEAVLRWGSESVAVAVAVAG